MNSKYNNGKIYKIKDNALDMIYVGSTCKTLKQRLKDHEYQYKSFKAGKKVSNLSSFQILKNGNYSIELIENYSCENKKTLEKREGYYIKLYRNQELNIVNKCVAGQDPYEYIKCKCGYGYIHKKQAKHNRSYIHRKKMGLITNGNNNDINININIFCQSKDDINDLVELEKDFINTINGNNNNINIIINNLEDLKQLELDFLNAIKI
jgi:hypothetical protein